MSIRHLFARSSALGVRAALAPLLLASSFSVLAMPPKNSVLISVEPPIPMADEKAIEEALERFQLRFARKKQLLPALNPAQLAQLVQSVADEWNPIATRGNELNTLYYAAYENVINNQKAIAALPPGRSKREQQGVNGAEIMVVIDQSRWLESLTARLIALNGEVVAFFKETKTGTYSNQAPAAAAAALPAFTRAYEKELQAVFLGSLEHQTRTAQVLDQAERAASLAQTTLDREEADYQAMLAARAAKLAHLEELDARPTQARATRVAAEAAHLREEAERRAQASVAPSQEASGREEAYQTAQARALAQEAADRDDWLAYQNDLRALNASIEAENARRGAMAPRPAAATAAAQAAPRGYEVTWDPQAKKKLQKLADPATRNAIKAVVEKLRHDGPDLVGTPHSTHLAQDRRLFELRPNSGQSNHRILYAENHGGYIILAIVTKVGTGKLDANDLQTALERLVAMP